MPLRYTEFLLFVQITAMLHLSAGPMAPADAIPATPVTVDVQVGSVEIGELWQPCYTMAPSYKSCASSTTSPFHLDKNRLEWPAPFSGRGDSVVMRLLHGMRFFMQGCSSSVQRSTSCIWNSLAEGCGSWAGRSAP
ncbi:uncharacterized protein LOC144127802 isoform X2 [Amblyomma americanum]